MASWTWAAASRRGTSHERTGEPRQDAFRCVRSGRKVAFLVAVACDGAGSAKFGGVGAALASRSISQRAKTYCRATRRLPPDSELLEWVDEARDQIAAVADRRQLLMRDFATTLVMTISNAAETLTVHIGDGAAIARCAATGQWETLSWPAHGEYASTTFFLTDDGLPQTRISRRQSPIDRLAVFTDGIERLALDFANLQPHAPFFDAVSAPVAASGNAGLDLRLSTMLGRYLCADAINSRTDDDKTLILASTR